MSSRVQTARARTTTTRKPRDPWPDNARFIAAILIVMMHFGDQVPGKSDLLEHVFFLTWPARVPLYALLAGYFSDASPFTRRRAVGLVRNVLLVYLCFEMLATVHKWLLGGRFAFDPGTPSLALWFLLSLFIWRATLPLLATIRWIVPLSVVVALVAGFAPSIGPAGSMSRTVAFLPVFLLGWKLRQHGLREVLDRTWVRWAAAGVLLVWSAAIVAILADGDLKRRWFSMVKPYAQSNLVGDLEARTLVLVGGGMLAALAVLALAPRSRLPWISYLGTGSMYIYLLHPFLVRQAVDAGLLERLDSRTDVVLMLAGTAVVGALLATPPVRRLLRPIIQPTYTWLFLPEPSAPRRDVPVTESARPSAHDASVSGSTASPTNVPTENLDNVAVAGHAVPAVHLDDAPASHAPRPEDPHRS